MANVTAPRGKRGGLIIRNTQSMMDYWGERITQVISPGEWPEDREYASIIMRGDSLYHYGRHFELARIIRRANGRARIVLLNGDDWPGASGFGPSTASRQADVRKIVARETAGTRISSLVIPFSALDAASIRYDSIRVLDYAPERTETKYHQSNEDPRTGGSGRPPVAAHEFYGYDLGQDSDGVWTWTTQRHWLGDAVFTAESREWRTERDERGLIVSSVPVDRRAKYLSSFDYQEPRALYFLCELPRSGARTIEEAYESLKPTEVVNALASGVDVLRQGDVFAIPTSLTTRELKSRATPHTYRTGELDENRVFVERQTDIRKRTRDGAAADVLGTNHRPTELIVTKDGDHYGRGIMYHDPQGFGRMRDHVNLKLGDGRTWYRLVKNTVPTSHSRSNFPQARAWTIGGRVD